MHRLISYFLSNTSAKNYRNRIVHVKTIASQMWDVFETKCSRTVYLRTANQACEKIALDSAAMWPNS